MITQEMCIKTERLAMVTPEMIAADASARTFGQRIVSNKDRGTVTECIVARALPGSRLTADWAGWDVDYEGARIEVKQTAMRQTWDTTRTINRKPAFDIAARTGHYDAKGWNESDGRKRNANIYVLAFHPIADESADHRDPSQWRFYVIAANALPAQNTICLRKVQWMTTSVGFDELAARTAEVIDVCTTQCHGNPGSGNGD